MRNTNQNIIDSLRAKVVNTLLPLITSDFVLLDLPDYGNIGDHLIYAGEKEFLEKYVSTHKLLYSANDYIPKGVKFKEDTIIFLQGGGNFGDIYDRHQNFRKKIIQDYPNNRIIILPQTVYYKDQLNLKKDCLIFNEHKNLFICVRDSKSYDLLLQYMSEDQIFLLPDMAFFLDLSDNIQEVKTSNKKALLMHRVDVEATGNPDDSLIKSLTSSGYQVDIKDWPTFYNTLDIKYYRKYIRYKSFLIRRMLDKNILPSLIKSDTLFEGLKNHYLKQGIKFMNPYDVVYTTRLHGLILAILLNKEVVALDNSYGKLSSFYDAWLMDFARVELDKK